MTNNNSNQSNTRRKNTKSGATKKASRRRTDPIDPLQITENLGYQTFRRESRKPWLEEEDSLLVSLVEKALAGFGVYVDSSGNNPDLEDGLKTAGNIFVTRPLPENVLSYNDLVSWDLMSKLLPSRKPKDCRKRWSNSLDPSLKKGRWTKQEDQLLLKAYNDHGASWQKVALDIPGRTDDQCAKRYIEVLDPTMTEDRLRKWDTKEDLLLISLVKLHGTRWRTVSFSMNSRPSLTCRNRWRKIITDVTRGKANEKVKRAVEEMKATTDLEAPLTPKETGGKKGKSKTKTTPPLSTPSIELDFHKITPGSGNSIGTSSIHSSGALTTTPITQLSRNFEKTILGDELQLLEPTIRRHSYSYSTGSGLTLRGMTRTALHTEAEKALVGLQTSVNEEDSNPRLQSSGSSMTLPLQSPVVLTEDTINYALSNPPTSSELPLSSNMLDANSKANLDVEYRLRVQDKQGREVNLSDILGKRSNLDELHDNVISSKSMVGNLISKCKEAGLNVSLFQHINYFGNPSDETLVGDGLDSQKYPQYPSKFSHSAPSSSGMSSSRPISSFQIQDDISGLDPEGVNNLYHNIVGVHRKQNPPVNGISKRSSVISTPLINSRRKSISSVSSANSSKFSRSPKSGLNSSRSNVNSVNTTPYTADNSANIHRSALLNKKAAYDSEDLEDGIDFWDNIRYHSKPPVSGHNVSHHHNPPNSSDSSIHARSSGIPNQNSYFDYGSMHAGGSSGNDIQYISHESPRTHQTGQQQTDAHLLNSQIISNSNHKSFSADDNQFAMATSSSSQQTLQTQHLPVSEHHPLHYEQANSSLTDSKCPIFFYSNDNDFDPDIDDHADYDFLPFNPS